MSVQHVWLFKVEGATGLRGVTFVKRPSRGDETTPDFVCFEYKGSVSPSRGQDLEAGAEVMC